MKNQQFFQVDAFTSRLFSGNPAAVVPLSEWISEDVMQSIAMENNLAETAFFVPEGEHYRIRWFTPLTEVDLCGHATLATAHVLFNHLGYTAKEILFQSRSGILRVFREGKRIVLDFPADEFQPAELPDELVEALWLEPHHCYLGKTDYLLIYANQQEIESLAPDFTQLKKIKARGVIVSAPGDWTDFVSRFFAPHVGIDEDPVTGSAHTTLTPYWSRQLAKSELIASQLSQRGGILYCKDKGNRVEIGGEACTYLKGEIFY